MKREELISKAESLAADMEALEERIDKEENEAKKELLTEDLAAKSAEFEAVEKEVERIDAKSARADRLGKLKTVARVEGKKADLSEPKVEMPDTEHNAKVTQRKLDQAAFYYLTEGKSGKDALRDIASKSGDSTVEAIKLGRVDADCDAGAIRLPSWMRDVIAPKSTAMSQLMSDPVMAAKIAAYEAKASSNDVVVSDASGTNSGGGSLVDTTFDPRLYKRNVNVVHDIPSMCYVKRAVGKQAIFPKLSQNATTPFGVAIQRGDGSQGEGEGGSITESNPVFSQVTVNTGRLACLSQASLKEVRRADVGFEAEMAWMFQNAARYAMGQDILVGSYANFNGAGLPLGITDKYSIDTLSVQTLARETASKVSYVDCAKMPFQVDEGVTDEGMYVISGGASGAAQYMYSLDDSSGRPVFFNEFNGWVSGNNGPRGTVAGRPYLRTKALNKNVGQRGDLVYGNFRHYAFVIDNEMGIERSDHYAFNTGLVTYRLIMYVGGRVLDGNAFCVLDDVSGVSSSSSSSSS